MIKLETQVIVALIATVVVAVLLSFGVNHYVGLRNAAAQNESRGQVIATTSEQNKDNDTVAEQAREENTHVATAREEFKVTIQEAKRNEPATATRATNAVPDSVRNAYRQRRLARERSGSDSQRSE